MLLCGHLLLVLASHFSDLLVTRVVIFLHDVTHSLGSHLLEELLVYYWVVSLLSIDNDYIHTGHADRRRVVECIINKLLLDSNLELPLLLLQLDNDVFHILLDLVLLLQLEPGAGIQGKFGIVLVLLFADQ